MNNEDKFQRQMEFILNQQAQFAADIGQLKDLHNQQSQIVTRLNDVVTPVGYCDAGRVQNYRKQNGGVSRRADPNRGERLDIE